MRRLTLARVGAGLVVGVVGFAISAVSHLVISGLATGVVIGVGGGVVLVTSPHPGWLPGVGLTVATSLLVLARDLWWRSAAARVTAILTVAVLVAAGAATFFPEFPVEIGTHPILEELVIGGAQSTATYAFAGLLVGSLVLDSIGRRWSRPLDTATEDA